MNKEGGTTPPFLESRGNMPERILKSGITVKTRVVPTHAIVQVGAQFKRPIAPKVALRSVAGHSEMVTAPDDSPEWQAFIQAEDDYKSKVDKAKNDFIYDYAVEAWRNGTGEWQTEAPADWQFPEIFKAHGLQPSDNKRADYVRYELLRTNDDVGAVLDDALGNTAPITNAEVDAALGGFPDNEKRKSDPRRAGKRNQRR
jgi:hypothetical protein